ncbi:MAG: HDOD domain-containing protein [Pseudomonadota bacterium]
MTASNAVQSAGFSFVESLAEELSTGTIELPAFPDIVIKIRRALEDDNCTIDTISQLLSSEPALATRMLQLANSAALRRGPDPVTEVGIAINLLGRDIVQNSVMAYAMRQMKQTQKLKTAQPYLESVWREGVNIASVCHVLAKKFTKLSADQALLAGLLHGVGKLYILSKAEQYPDLFADEESLLGLLAEWHCPIGESIIESLGFGDELAHAVGNYQDNLREHEGEVDFTDVLTIAYQVAGLLNDEENFEMHLADVPASQYFATSIHDFFEILHESQEHIDSLKSALGG